MYLQSSKTMLVASTGLFICQRDQNRLFDPHKLHKRIKWEWDHSWDQGNCLRPPHMRSSGQQLFSYQTESFLFFRNQIMLKTSFNTCYQKFCSSFNPAGIATENQLSLRWFGRDFYAVSPFWDNPVCHPGWGPAQGDPDLDMVRLCCMKLRNQTLICHEPIELSSRPANKSISRDFNHNSSNVTHFSLPNSLKV